MIPVKRMTISLPEELIKRLRVMAAQRRTSMASIIREAVEEKVVGKRPKPKSLAAGRSGTSTTSVEASGLRAEPRSWR